MKRRENGEYKIDKDIPLPKRKSSGYSLTTTMRAMKVGDSVYVPNARTGNHTGWLVLGKGNYAVRNEKTGTRVWRTK